MEFTEFVKKLRDIIGGSESKTAFTKTLFEAIISEEHLSLLDEKSASSYKAYSNGSTQITNIAKTILPYIDPELFAKYLNEYPEATTNRLCDEFKDYIEDIDLYNATEKIAYYFEDILKEAAKKERKSTTSSAKDTKEGAPSDSKSSIDDDTSIDIDEKQLNDDDTAFLKDLRTDVKPLLKYCIDTDPTGEPISIKLTDEINAFTDKWKYEVLEIKDNALRVLTNDIMKTLNEYTYYLSDKFLRLLPNGEFLIFRNSSIEEGEQLRNVLRPESYKKRCEIRDLYLRLYPTYEDKYQQEPNKTIIQHQTNIVQNGDNNVNLTNNGTININL